ncbi:GNAT family N-acetyltransferase [Balneatrix alpica]|uniref:GNAT family N-acetyltransferase n=1 Tax=Balneatrix alpica TaxID=75684 RepID=A0ABV5ZFA9_9GAMM|nr:GNAT family protein [Balneatrix alpica]
MGFSLTSQRLHLRDFREDDLESYVELYDSETYARYYSEEDCSAVRCHQLVQQFINETKQHPRQHYHLAITEKGKDKLIGVCSLRLEDHRQASIGCGIATSHQGASYAYEAMQTLFNLAFKVFAVHRIYAETIAENSAALHLCRQLGMQQEGHLIQHRYFRQRWWDTVIMAIKEEQWHPG